MLFEREEGMGESLGNRCYGASRLTTFLKTTMTTYRTEFVVISDGERTPGPALGLPLALAALVTGGLVIYVQVTKNQERL